MGMVPASELARIQADAIAAVCDKTCDIWHKSTVPDGYGSQTPTYSLFATTVAGMSEPTAGQLQNYDYLIGGLAAWHVRLPVGSAVSHQDHLVIDGVTLEVQVILEPRSYAVLLSVIASEVQ